jgi:hemoglobin/transferrin/lactoferrin receptor protein
VGSARLLYHLRKDLNIYGGVSQGFRAPNLSDLTRYDIAQSGQQEVPNTSLKPEKFVSYETGIKMRSEKWHTELSVFYTAVNDMIMRYPTGAMVGSNYEVQKANIGDGFMQGCEAKADYRISPQWSLFSGAAYIRGEVDTYPASAQLKDREPMNKVQPLQGILGGRWNDVSQKYWAEAFMKAADRQDRFSPEDRMDTQRIPPDGTPGYTVFNIRGGWQASDNVAITAGIENIGNIDYRIHGSGTNEPGRNFIIALDARF